MRSLSDSYSEDVTDLELGRAASDLADINVITQSVSNTIKAVDVRAMLDQHHEAAWRWAKACCRGDQDMAHDVLQDAYLKILDGRASFGGKSTFKTWLFGVIRMTSRSIRRKQMFLGLIMAPVSSIDDFAAPDRRADDISTSHAMEKALKTLSFRQREVAILIFQNDQTLEEAAIIMGVSVGSCRTHYSRAKEKLRKTLSAGMGR